MRRFKLVHIINAKRTVEKSSRIYGDLTELS